MQPDDPCTAQLKREWREAHPNAKVVASPAISAAPHGHPREGCDICTSQCTHGDEWDYGVCKVGQHSPTPIAAPPEGENYVKGNARDNRSESNPVSDRPVAIDCQIDSTKEKEAVASPAMSEAPPACVSLVGDRKPTAEEIKFGETLEPLAEEVLKRHAQGAAPPAGMSAEQIAVELCADLVNTDPLLYCPATVRKITQRIEAFAAHLREEVARLNKKLEYCRKHHMEAGD